MTVQSILDDLQKDTIMDVKKKSIIINALTLQNEKEVKDISKTDMLQKCPNCGECIFRKVFTKYCEACGQKLKFKENEES